MKTRKTTLILTETHEVLSIRLNFPTPPQREPVWCQACRSDTPMLTPEEAAPLAGLSANVVRQLVQDGLIHSKETPDGLLLVCLSSVMGKGSSAGSQPQNSQRAFPRPTGGRNEPSD